MAEPMTEQELGKLAFRIAFALTRGDDVFADDEDRCQWMAKEVSEYLLASPEIAALRAELDAAKKERDELKVAWREMNKEWAKVLAERDAANARAEKAERELENVKRINARLESRLQRAIKALRRIKHCPAASVVDSVSVARQMAADALAELESEPECIAPHVSECPDGFYCPVHGEPPCYDEGGNLTLHGALVENRRLRAIIDKEELK